MRAYIIRRLLLIIPTLFILTILVFLSVRFIPGDAIDAMANELEYLGIVPDREALEHKLGLDVPVWVQYGRWMGAILLHGTLGEPLWGGAASIEEKILDRLPVTIELGVMAIVIGLLDSAARRHLLGDSPGYRRRLRGTLHRHHRPGNAQLLAGPDGHGLPGNLVGLVATDAADSFHGRPAGKSGGVPHSQPDSGDGHRPQAQCG